MIWTKLTFVVSMLLSIKLMVVAGKWECPQQATNPRGRSPVGQVSKADSWEDCSAKCFAAYGCELWTWVKPSGGAYAKNCALMSGATSYVYDANVISGQKSCRGAGAGDDYVELEYGAGDCHSFDCFAK